MKLRKISALLLPGLMAACTASVYQEGPSLGEDPGLLGPNITEEIEQGEFFVGPHDTLQLEVYGHSDLNKVSRVEEDGTVFFHLVKSVPVAGLTQPQVRDKLVQAYSRYLVDPSLDVTVTMSQRRKVTVLGQVARRGVYPLSQPRVTVLDILAEAGGVTGEGDRTGVLVSRMVEGVREVRAYNLDLMWQPPDPDIRTEIPFIHPGDYVYVVRKSAEEFSDAIRLLNDVMRTTLIFERVIQNSARLDIAISGS